MIEKLALAQAFNDAWALVAFVTAAATLSLLVIIRVDAKKSPRHTDRVGERPLPARMRAQAPPAKLGL